MRATDLAALAGRFALAAVGRIVRTAFPPVCLVCGAARAGDGVFDICPACAAALSPAGRHACRRCAAPIDGELAGAGVVLCGDCRISPPPFDAAVAALRYEGKTRELIHRYKFAGKTRLAGALGPLLCAALHRAGEMEGIDFVIPVPLHRRRLFRRGYNQSWLLAAEVGKTFGVPVAADLLARARFTEPQFSLSRAARRTNIKNAFTAPSPERLAGKALLLVDDIMTTGATLGEAARTLKKGGAARVVCAVAARAG